MTKEAWNQVGVSGLRSLLSSRNIESTVDGTTIKACCPFHDEKTPSFYIRVKEKYTKCFGCGYFENNLVCFTAKLKNVSWGAALLELRNLGCKLPAKTALKMQEQEKRDSIRNEVAYVTNKFLLSITDSSDGDIGNKCIEFLRDRGVTIDDTTLSTIPMGCLPPISYVMSCSELRDKQAVVEYLTGGYFKANYANYVGSLVIYHHSTPSRIGGFRIRHEFLTNSPKKLYKVLGPQVDEPDLGLVGLSNYRTLFAGKSRGEGSPVILVEGEFDMVSWLVGDLNSGNHYLSDIVLSISGAMTKGLESLSNLAVSHVYLALDNPRAEPVVIEKIKALVESTDLPVSILNWEDIGREKDPDEYIHQNGFKKWNELISAVTSDGSRLNFCSSLDWALRGLEDQCTDTLEPRDALQIVSSWGYFLNSAVEKSLYARKAAKLSGLPMGEINDQLISAAETEESFIARIRIEISNIYRFVGIEHESNRKPVLTLWNRGRGYLKEIELHKGASDFINSVSTDIGSAVKWVQSNVGIPSFVSHKTVGDNLVRIPIPAQQKKIKEYFELALLSLLPEVKSMRNLKRLRRGAHFVNVNYGGYTMDSWIVVNGTKAYIGRPKEGASSLYWRELVDPVIGDYYFIPQEDETWSSEISDISDLREASTTTLPEVFDLMSRSIEVAWVFEESTSAPDYLSAAMILNCLNGMLDRHIYTIINGEPGTGKSSFSEFFMDGPSRLLECCFIDDEYTAASFRSKANGWPGGIWLDEFEDKAGTSKGRIVRQCLEHLRALTSKKIAKISRGTSSNTHNVEFELQCQVWASAIEPLRNMADITRFMRFRTVSKPDHGDSFQILQEHFEEDRFTEARRFLSAHVYDYYEEILSNIDELRGIYTRKSSNTRKLELCDHIGGIRVPPRFMGMLVLCAAVAKAAGKNPHEFMKRVCKDQSQWIGIMSETSTHSQLFSDILSSSVSIRGDSETGRTTIRRILSSSSERVRLQEYDVGLAYIEFDDQMWLIVHWEDALPNLLAQSRPAVYRSETSARLQAKANRDERVVSYHSARKIHSGRGGFKKYLGSGIRISSCTIYDLRKFIEEADDD
jgi:hypothetical protein